nr:MAG TPA: hypothetical protein [Caudoviricetes sp.]
MMSKYKTYFNTPRVTVYQNTAHIANFHLQNIISYIPKKCKAIFIAFFVLS